MIGDSYLQRFFYRDQTLYELENLLTLLNTLARSVANLAVSKTDKFAKDGSIYCDRRAGRALDLAAF
jgi:hypothetical protein